VQLLNDALAAALRAVERALAARPVGERLAPESVQVTVKFSAVEGTAHADPAGPHSVTVNCRVTAAGTVVPTEPPPVRASTNTPPDDIGTTLAQLFGAPGFDSSARATVFRETLAGCAQADALTALAALRTGAPSPADERLKTISQILRGLFQSGPTKPVARAAELCSALLSRHALADVLRVAETAWKTQDDWLD
jgi:hypothetical protein